eukprot:GHUV01054941.1.p1 GENE.GHUV01054941.1~~GHUV01054941.1.p1  ORF type:complete len:117 (+),score=26.69 GHUV01054941.1:366-716(+)
MLLASHADTTTAWQQQCCTPPPTSSGASPYLQEVYKLECMCSVAEEEVQPLVYVLDVHTLTVCSSPQDQLLKVQERALVRDVLTHLQQGQQVQEPAKTSHANMGAVNYHATVAKNP